MLLRIVPTAKTNQIRVGGPVSTVCFVFLIQSSVGLFLFFCIPFLSLKFLKDIFGFYGNRKSELLFFMSPGFMITFY